MAVENEFGIVYNNDYNAWYIIYRLKGTKEFKIDTKCEVRNDIHGNDCITDTFISRAKEVAQMGYVFNPYMSIGWFSEIDWF